MNFLVIPPNVTEYGVAVPTAADGAEAATLLVAVMVRNPEKENEKAAEAVPATRRNAAQIASADLETRTFRMFLRR